MTGPGSIDSGIQANQVVLALGLDGALDSSVPMIEGEEWLNCIGESNFEKLSGVTGGVTVGVKGIGVATSIATQKKAKMNEKVRFITTWILLIL